MTTATAPLTTTGLLLRFGVHEFKAAVRPAGASKRSCYPCRVCGTSRKHPCHRMAPTSVAPPPALVSPAVPAPAVAQDESSVVVTCPTCDGTGTFHLAISDVRRLAARKAGKAS